MKKIFIIIIVAALVLVLIGNKKNDNTEILNTNVDSSNLDINVNSGNNTNKENNTTVDSNKNSVVENNVVENENNIENNIQNDEQDNETSNNVENKEPDNSYVGQEENSKDDYDSELDGENKAIVLVKQYLGERASNYTFNVETTTSSAYVVRAMDENSSNTYYSVNFTTWVVSEI